MNDIKTPTRKEGVKVTVVIVALAIAAACATFFFYGQGNAPLAEVLKNELEIPNFPEKTVTEWQSALEQLSKNPKFKHQTPEFEKRFYAALKRIKELQIKQDSSSQVLEFRWASNFLKATTWGLEDCSKHLSDWDLCKTFSDKSSALKKIFTSQDMGAAIDKEILEIRSLLDDVEKTIKETLVMEAFVVAQLAPNTYEVSVGGGRNHLVLFTKETKFQSKGWFRIHVKKGDKISMKLSESAGNFDALIQTYTEVINNEKNIQERKRLKKELAEKNKQFEKMADVTMESKELGEVFSFMRSLDQRLK